METATLLPKLRPLGALERYLTTRSELGIYYNVAVTATYEFTTQSLPSDFRSTLFSALRIVIPQHPVLSAIPMDMDTSAPYFARLPSIDLDEVVRFIDVEVASDAHDQTKSFSLDRFLEKQHNHPFKHTQPPLPFWRFNVLQNSRNAEQFTLSLLFHHCITDTKGAMALHQQIEAALNTISEGTPASMLRSQEEPLLPPLDTFLDKLSTDSVPVYQQQRDNEWTGAKQFLPVKTRFRSYWLSAERTRLLLNRAKENGLSLTAVLQTMLVAAIFEIEPDATTMLRVDCPVSLRSWLPHPVTETAMGCFIDNFSTTHGRSTFNWDEARRTKASIDAVLQLQLKGGDNLCRKVAQIPDLRKWLEAKIGQTRPSALELSNIGKFTPLELSNICKIQSLLFSQSAGACSGAVKVSVATGRDNRLSLGFSWQEGVVQSSFIADLVLAFQRILEDALETQKHLD